MCCNIVLIFSECVAYLVVSFAVSVDYSIDPVRNLKAVVLSEALDRVDELACDALPNKFRSEDDIKGATIIAESSVQIPPQLLCAKA